MEKNRWSFVPGIIVAGLFIIGCKPAAVRPPQASLQDPVPPPPPQAYAAAPDPSPDGPPPPPPPGRGRRTGPPPSVACGPDAPPRPAAAAYPTAPAVTVRNTVRQFNYGPDGEISGFLLSNGTQVNFPSNAGEQFASLAKPKSEVSITGYPR